MNGVALLVALSALGVDHTWRQTADGQVEYVLQVEPVYLQALAEGKEIHSLLPDDVQRVDRLCIRIGSGSLAALPQSAPDWPELQPPAEQQAAGIPYPDAPLGIYVQASGDAYKSYDLTHGWQTTEDATTYLVQIDPESLKTLSEGDEFYAAVHPEAGAVRAFTVTAGKKRLPRDAGKPPVMTVAQLQDTGGATAADAASSPASDIPPTSDFTGGNSSIYGPPSPDATATRGTDLGNVPSTAPPGSRFNLRDAGAAPLAAGHPEASQPGAGVLLEVPQFDRSQFGRSQPGAGRSGGSAAAAADRRRSAASASAGVRSVSQQPPPAPQDDLYAEDDYAAGRYERQEPPPRLAARTTPQRSFDQELAAGTGPRAAGPSEEEEKPQFPPFWIAVCIFALFFSVGGNFYLAWTAAEFYSRYKLAVERLRSAGR